MRLKKKFYYITTKFLSYFTKNLSTVFLFFFKLKLSYNSLNIFMNICVFFFFVTARLKTFSGPLHTDSVISSEEDTLFINHKKPNGQIRPKNGLTQHTRNQMK